MRRFIDGALLDTLNLWFVVAMLILLAMLVWGAIQIQNHYYFDTVPFNWKGLRIP